MYFKKYSLGVAFCFVLALAATFISNSIPSKLISGGVFSLIIGMVLNPFVGKYVVLKAGIAFTSKHILRLAIIIMGITLNFSQIFKVGKYSLVVMCFTLFVSFTGGYFLGKLFGMNWKLSSLISAGTGICGGSAIAAIAPTIDAKNSDVVYAISATFLFDILMVILFPIAGRYLNMSDMGFGLWTGTAVNDTSSVVAAGYAFSDAAGAYSLIVKLTRTLSIIPTVMVFSIIHQRMETKQNQISVSSDSIKASKRSWQNNHLRKIFPYFILLFLLMVAFKSTGLVSDTSSQNLGSVSKFLMIMSLGAIGLKTNFKEVSHLGYKPMIHGFILSISVVLVALVVQIFLKQV